MARSVPKAKWDRFAKLRDEGHSFTAARKAVGISYDAAKNYEDGDSKSSGADHREARLTPVKAYETLIPEAKRAYHDFEYFRTRYLGRTSEPWQVMAANEVREALETDDREWIVSNAPPGSGKSTLFTCDIPLWLIVRNRALRVLIGSYAQRTADKYTRLIKEMLSLKHPLKAPMNSRGQIDAVATLAHDFGRFEPEKRDLWARDQFIVEQPDARATANKEPSFSAYGHGAAFLGTRYDLIVWDDLVEDTVLRSAVQREYQRDWWDQTAETRLEPGGVCVLNGQRMGTEDLFRYNLDKSVPHDDEDDDDFDETTAEYLPQYRHICYPSHDDEKCKGHRFDDGTVNPDHKKSGRPWPEGCLLDPRNIGWKYLRAIESANPSTYKVQYQQEDVDPDEVLVQKLWITGGTDQETGEEFSGCLDNERGIGEPISGLVGNQISVITVDPSPSNYWAIEWWLLQDVPDGLYTLMDLHRGRLQYPQFFEEPNRGEYVGLLVDYVEAAKKAGHRLRYLIFEANAAQKFMLQQEPLQRYCRQQGLSLIAHYTTGKNKGDPDFGVQSLAPLFKHGRVRLPNGSGEAKHTVNFLVDEVTRYNTAGGQSAATDDTVMAMWFMHWRRRSLVYATGQATKARRPSWMSRRPHGR